MVLSTVRLVGLVIMIVACFPIPYVNSTALAILGASIFFS